MRPTTSSSSLVHWRVSPLIHDPWPSICVSNSALPSLAAGVTPVEKCEYDFGYKDVATFLATASILEGVGVSAYLGAAADIMSKTYLTAAGSILTVEARHSAYLRAKLEQSPFPQAFDAPLSLNQVFSLASGFITSCPESNPALPVKAFPALALEATSPIKTGDTVTLLTKVSKRLPHCEHAHIRRQADIVTPRRTTPLLPRIMVPSTRLSSPLLVLPLSRPLLLMVASPSRSPRVSPARPTSS